MTEQQIKDLIKILKEFMPLAEFSDDVYRAQDLLNWAEAELLKK